MAIFKRFFLLGLCLMLGLGSFIPVTAQQPPVLPVRLTDTQTFNPGSLAQAYVEYHGAVYFLAYNDKGSGLWKTDGSPAGTVKILDQIIPLDVYRADSPYILFKDELYFQTTAGLVKTDGTPGQYTQIFAAGVPKIKPVVMGEYLYFIPAAVDLGDGTFQLQLWRTDGTPGGTQVVASSISTGDVYFYSGAVLKVFNNRLYFQFLAGDDAELWSSDGTVAGTALFKDLYPAASSHPQNLAVFNGNLFFSAHASDGVSRLWRSDGSPAGTSLFTAGAQEWVFPAYLTAAGRYLYFTTTEISTGRLWQSDGTPQNTSAVDLNHAGTQYTPVAATLAPVGTQLFFFARSPVGSALWKADGLSAGAQWVHKLSGDSSYIPNQRVTVVQDRIFFGDNPQYISYDNLGSSWSYRPAELWTSDGTTGGTQMVKQVFPHEMIALGSQLIFTGNDQHNGLEPWRSDGTPDGTTLVLNLNNIPNPYFPRIYIPAATRLYFVPLEGFKTAPKFRLWMSRGEPHNTGPLPVPGPCDDVGGLSAPMSGGYLAALGDTLIYPGPACALWRTDGTAAGTWQLPNANWAANQNTPPYLTPLGQRIFFFSNPSLNGLELWSSDGSQDPAGTFKVSQISNNCDSAVLTQPPVVMNGALYFVTSSNSTGCQGTSWWKFWRSDGTPAGTQVLAAVDPAYVLSRPNHLTVSGARVYFCADQPQSGILLWESDGSAAGTHPVDSSVRSISSLADRSGSLMIYEQPYSVLPNGNWLYAPRLETTRGSVFGGVQTVFNFDPFETPSYTYPANRQMLSAGGQVYFIRYYDGSGFDLLWASDGTAAGTQVVLNEHGRPMHASILTNGGGRLFFSGGEGAVDEIWTSDGTPAGTHLIADLNPSSLVSSDPQGYAWANQRLFFFANDGVHGPELWVYHHLVNQIRLPLVSR